MLKGKNRKRGFFQNKYIKSLFLFNKLEKIHINDQRNEKGMGNWWLMIINGKSYYMVAICVGLLRGEGRERIIICLIFSPIRPLSSFSRKSFLIEVGNKSMTRTSSIREVHKNHLLWTPFPTLYEITDSIYPRFETLEPKSPF